MPNKILDVLIIGAGFGGICAAIKLKQAGIENFQVFDKAGARFKSSRNFKNM